MAVSTTQTPLRILIADDEADSRYSLSLILQIAGNVVDEVGNGEEALSAIMGALDEPYDLLIIDHQMPQMTGLELLIHLRREGIHMPTLVITAHADRDLVFQFLQMDVVSIIRKPFTPDDLMHMVKAIKESLSVASQLAPITNGEGLPKMIRQSSEVSLELPIGVNPDNSASYGQYIQGLVDDSVKRVKLDCSRITHYSSYLVAEIMWLLRVIEDLPGDRRLCLVGENTQIAKCIRSSGIAVDSILELDERPGDTL